METTRRPRAVAVAVLVTGGLLLLLRRLRRRRPVRAGSDPEHGGGLAGVREPRRPLPQDLVGAAAADPAE